MSNTTTFGRPLKWFVQRAGPKGMCRVVQRSKWNTFFDTVDNFVGNQNGFAVQFAAAYHAVADRTDTGVEAVGFELVHQCFYRAGMVWLGGQFNFMFFAVELKVM